MEEANVTFEGSNGKAMASSLWEFCDKLFSSSLPSDITLIVGGVNFHLCKAFSDLFCVVGKICYMQNDVLPRDENRLYVGDSQGNELDNMQGEEDVYA